MDDNYVDVTNVDKIELVKKVYELSRPQGLGFLNYTPDPLTDEEAKLLIREDGTISLDYVKGRSCKFSLYKENERIWMDKRWYDHSDEQMRMLLNYFNLS